MPHKLAEKTLIKSRFIKYFIYLNFLILLIINSGLGYLVYYSYQYKEMKKDFLPLQATLVSKNYVRYAKSSSGNGPKYFKILGKFNYELNGQKRSAEVIMKDDLHVKEDAEHLIQNYYPLNKEYKIYYYSKNNSKLSFDLTEYSSSKMTAVLVYLGLFLLPLLYMLNKIKNRNFYLYNKGRNKVYIDPKEYDRIMKEIEEIKQREEV